MSGNVALGKGGNEEHVPDKVEDCDTLLQVWDHADIRELIRDDLLRRVVSARRELGKEGTVSAGKK